jgi:hypothetical protein
MHAESSRGAENEYDNTSSLIWQREVPPDKSQSPPLRSNLLYSHEEDPLYSNKYENLARFRSKDDPTQSLHRTGSKQAEKLATSW